MPLSKIQTLFNEKLLTIGRAVRPASQSAQVLRLLDCGEPGSGMRCDSDAAPAAVLGLSANPRTWTWQAPAVVPSSNDIPQPRDSMESAGMPLPVVSEAAAVAAGVGGRQPLQAGADGSERTTKSTRSDHLV